MINKAERPMSCYTSRSTFCKGAVGGIFILPSGIRRLVPDNLLCFAQLSEDARELKLAYSCCVVILYGQELQAIFDDAVKQQLGEVRQADMDDNCPGTGLWVDILQIIDPPGIEDQAFDDYVDKRKQQLTSDSGLEGTTTA